MNVLKNIVSMLVAVFLLVVTSLAPVLAAVVPGDPPGLAIAIAVQESHTDEFLAMDGVVGTAVGVRGDGVPVVQILTESADVSGFPRFLDGVPVVVKVTGLLFSRHHRLGHDGGPGGGGDDTVDPTARFDRPVPIGVSTGHPDITAGTIGSRVIDSMGNVYALSNNHVYANKNAASLGDAVIQPGAFDGGTIPEESEESLVDVIGTLDDFEAIDFEGGDNTIDAAIALTTTGLLGNATPSDGYGTPRTLIIGGDDTEISLIDLKVQKYGRTTGLTKGRIVGINATVNVGYGNGEVAVFVNQIIIRPGRFSAGGDSGSLIVSNQTGSVRRPVGLLFAGSSLFTVANPIDAVLTHFGVTIDGE